MREPVLPVPPKDKSHILCVGHVVIVPGRNERINASDAGSNKTSLRVKGAEPGRSARGGRAQRADACQPSSYQSERVSAASWLRGLTLWLTRMIAPRSYARTMTTLRGLSLLGSLQNTDAN
jgi:hypothetical protein